MSTDAELPRIACFMVAKNEVDLLEHWILYHADLFGYDNLYIWDNGSTRPEIRSIIEKYSWRGVNFLDGTTNEEHFRQKGVCIGNKIKNLEKFGYYDFYVPLDCDEFIALRGDRQRIIETRKKRNSKSFSIVYLVQKAHMPSTITTPTS